MSGLHRICWSYNRSYLSVAGYKHLTAHVHLLIQPPSPKLLHGSTCIVHRERTSVTDLLGPVRVYENKNKKNAEDAIHCTSRCVEIKATTTSLQQGYREANVIEREQDRQRH